MALPQKNGELIKVPNTLKNKIGGSMAQVDVEAIARAEAAIASLSANFDDWIVIEVDKLEAARRAVDDDSLCGPAGKALFNSAHDLKGLGTTYGYPIVTDFADSLCSITNTQELRDKASLKLVDAHVNAIRAAVKNGIKENTHPIGGVLNAELQAKTKSFLSQI